MSALPPVHKSVVVPLSAEDAFDLFVRRLPEWWPLAARSVSLADAESCHVEPHVGGRLYERARSGAEHTWGRFKVVEVGRRAVFSWHPGVPEGAATEVEVTFVAEGPSTRVDVLHRDWERLGARASFVRGLMDGGWLGVLARFVARGRGDRELPVVEGPGCIPREMESK
jgi:hypothetical protein